LLSIETSIDKCIQATNRRSGPAFFAGSGLMSITKLPPGEYLGRSRWQMHRAGLVLTLSSYEAGLQSPWHTHTYPTIFVLLNGAHRDQSRRQTCEQRVLTAVFHPVTEPHATEVGPAGMLGLNVEHPFRWLNRYGLRMKELGGCHMLDPVGSGLTVMRLLGALLESVAPAAEADLETTAFELLQQCVVSAKLRHLLRAPVWLRRAEEFLRSSFHLPISLHSVAHEAGVHPVYFARVFRRVYGCSVGTYLRTLRLVAAGQRVVCEGASLSAAAYGAGFADQSHYTRWCSRTLGFSPKMLGRIRRYLGADTRGSTHSRFADRLTLY
jgi:AraC-like DNA-binding protein